METTKLPAADRPREVYRYKVTGIGHFPTDMLRYDAAYPSNSDAVSALTSFRPGERGRRTVELRSHRRPTVDRWSSFGWTVLD
jgi:hypothetical protein